MYPKKSLLLSSLFFALVLQSLFSQALAFEQIRPDLIKAFNRVEDAIGAGKTETAEKLLKKADKKRNLNSIEAAYIANYRGNLAYDSGDMEAALNAYKDVLQYESDLPLSYGSQIHLVVAQIQFGLGRYAEAITHAEKWQCRQTEPGYNGLMLLTQSYYINMQYGKAKLALRRAMSNHAQNNQQPKPSWIRLAYKIYKEIEEFGAREKARDMMKRIYPRADIDFGEEIECATSVNLAMTKDPNVCAAEDAKKKRSNLYRENIEEER